MKKSIKRTLSLLLALTMVLSLGLPAYAVGVPEDDIAISEEPAVKTANLPIGAGKQPGIIGEDEIISDDLIVDIVDEETVVEEQAAPAKDFSYSESATGFSVEVSAPVGALPLGTEMVVDRLVDLYAVQAAVDTAENLNGKVCLAADISFWHEGNEIEPAEGTKLLVRMSSPEIAGIAEPVVIHIPDGENAVPEIVEQMKHDDDVVMVNTIEFEADSFSTFAVIWAGGQSATSENYTTLNFTGGYANGSVTVYYVDQNGNYIKKPTSVQNSYSYNLSGTSSNNPTTIPMSDFAKEIDGYEYQYALCTENGSSALRMTQLNAFLQSSYPRGRFMDGSTQRREIWLDDGSYRVILLVYSGETVVTGNQVTVHFGYIEGGAFVEFPEGSSTSTSYPTSLSTADYNSSTKPYAWLEYDFKGYTYKETRLGTAAGTVIRPVLRMTQTTPQYTTSTSPGNNNWSNLSNGQDIYVIYELTPFTTGVGGSSSGSDTPTPAAPEPLPSSKKVNDNHDGTFDITLSVTGQQNPTEDISRASVIVIFDVSGSMNYSLDGTSSTGGERMTTAKNAVYELADTLLGIVDEETHEHLVEMALISFSSDVTVHTFGTNADGSTKYFTTNYNDSGTASNPDRNGYRYQVSRLSAGGATNWEAALLAADALQASATAPTYVIFVTDGEPTYRVSRANETDEELFTETQRGDGYGDNFNWDESLTSKSYFGTGYSGYYELSGHFDAAVNAGIAIREHSKQFFGIGLSKDAATVENLVAGVYEGVELPEDEIAHYYPATKTEDISNAFATIAQAVRDSLGYSDVNLDDGVTELSTIEINLVSGSLDYTCRKGSNSDPMQNPVWNDAPAPEIDENHHVQWNPISGVDEEGNPRTLEDGVTYSITFTVWPSQAAYDLIADINNCVVHDSEGNVTHYNTKTEAFNAYKAMDPSLEGQIVLDAATGNYTLRTNTEYKLHYKYNGIEYEQDPTTPMENGSMPLPANYFSVTKEWSNLLPQDSRYAMMLTEQGTGYLIHKDGTFILDADGNKVGYWETEKIGDNGVTPCYYIDLIVTKGDNEYLEIRLTSEDTTPWKYDQMFIAPGSLTTSGTTIKVNETGSDYTVKEKPSDAYYWELHAVVYHPMVIDGTAYMLEKVEENIPEMDNNTVNGDYYKFGGTVYKKLAAATDASMTAVNMRRSYLNLTKAVTGSDNDSYNSDALFTYTVKLDYEDGNHPGDNGYDAYNDGFWFSAYDPVADATIMDLEVTGGNVTPEMKRNSETEELEPTGYWYFDNGGTITIKIKAGWNVRFTNLFTDTTYEITEIGMDEGYSFNKVEATAVLNGQTQTYNTTIADQKTNGAIEASNTNYTVTYTNDYLGCFYVYHAGDNTIEKIFLTDARVVNGKFNIAYETKDQFIYGGYYEDGGYADATVVTSGDNAVSFEKKGDDYKTKLAYVAEERTGGNWGTVDGGKAYMGDGNKWTASKAIDENGMAMTPVANTVYYLKEVPEAYLRGMIRYTYYDDAKNNYPIGALWLVCALDGEYKQYGIIGEGVKSSAGLENGSLTSQLTIEPLNAKNDKQIGIYNALSFLSAYNTKHTTNYRDGIVGYVKVYEKYISEENPRMQLIDEGEELCMFWVTPDNIRVTGTRLFSITNIGGAGQGSNNKITLNKLPSADVDRVQSTLTPPTSESSGS